MSHLLNHTTDKPYCGHEIAEAFKGLYVSDNLKNVTCAECISVYSNNNGMTEFYTARHYDTKSINSHSERTYYFVGYAFILSRELDTYGKPFTLMRFAGGRPLAKGIKVDGKEFWGYGYSWKQAEKKLSDFLTEAWEIFE